MEDVHHVVEDVSAEIGLEIPQPHAWFALFDGHAGTEAATNAKEHLLQDIANSGNYRSGLFKEAVQEGFKKTDEDFNKLCKELHAKGVYGYRSGCTAICTLLIGDRLIVCNLGDSRCIYYVNGTAEQLSVDHKPTCEEETIRIQKAGGQVLFNRVNGTLGVSRALGDYDFKEGCSENHLVSNCPDVMEFKITSETDFMILGCDGVWDVVTNEEACHAVSTALSTGTGNAQEVVQLASQALVDLAIEKYSSDNISAVVVTFH